MPLGPQAVKKRSSPMPFDDLAKNELISILELIDESQRCSNAQDLQKLIVKAAPLLEAEYAVCGLVCAGKDGVPAITSYINGNYPEEWVRRYIEKGYHLKDPVIRFHTNFAFTQTWADVFRQFEDKAAMQLVGEASDYGLKYGLTGAVYVPEMSNIAMFIFAGRNNNFGAHQKRMADILSMHFTRALADCAGASLAGAGQLSGDEGNPTQREGDTW